MNEFLLKSLGYVQKKWKTKNGLFVTNTLLVIAGIYLFTKVPNEVIVIYITFTVVLIWSIVWLFL